jgi:hypothetical protein
MATSILVAPDTLPRVIPQLYIPEGKAGMAMMDAFITHGHDIKKYVAIEAVHKAYTEWAKSAVHVIALLCKEHDANNVLICTHGVLAQYLAEAVARMICDQGSSNMFFDHNMRECDGFFITNEGSYFVPAPALD